MVRQTFCFFSLHLRNKKATWALCDALSTIFTEVDAVIQKSNSKSAAERVSDLRQTRLDAVEHKAWLILVGGRGSCGHENVITDDNYITLFARRNLQAAQQIEVRKHQKLVEAAQQEGQGSCNDLPPLSLWYSLASSCERKGSRRWHGCQSCTPFHIQRID